MRLSKLLFFVFIFIFSESYGQCTADAGPDSSVCMGATIQLGGIPSATGNGLITYTWAPTTGLSCTNCANPTLTVTTSQTYTLTITDGLGCTQTNTVNITALPVPTAGFNIIGNNNCANIPVSFVNTSSGTGLTYSWNFNDPSSGSSNTSNQPNPTHEFSLTGAGSNVYNVTLVVTGSNGCSASITQSVTIQASPGPLLMDPITDMKNCDGSNFAMSVYDASATGSVSNYQIQWGDGSADFNSASAPSPANHTYSTNDIFTMLYIVTGSNGCVDTASYNVANITNPAIGAANPGATTGCGPLTLCFPLSNFSSNHNTTYYVVDYGDGSPKDTLPHPPPSTICHTYTQSSCGQGGNQFVFSIKAINRCDSSEATVSPIRVYTGPQAHFNPVAINNCVNTPVQFNNTTIAGYNSSCNTSTVYQWNFGDGQTLTTPTLTHPTHVYTAPGTYTVTLTTTNFCGSNSESHDVCIEIPPVPNFNLNPDTACVPFVSLINNTSTLLNTCNVTTNWTVIFNGSPCLPGTSGFSFAGGTNASSNNPQIQFTNAGNYLVRLTLSNSCGAVNTQLPVVAQTIPQITINPLSAICTNASATPSAVINDCLEPTDSYSWTFAGGTPATSNSLTPGSITYPTTGTFPITLSATNNCGTANANSSITISPIPPALNPQVNSPLCEGDTAHFTSDFVNNVIYSWTGPNSFTSSLQNFDLNTVTTLQAGTYTLTGSLAGCPGPSSSINLVINPNPVVSVTPIASSYCLGGSVNLTASGASTYTWTPATGLSSTTGATVTASPTATQTYTVVGSNGTCSDTAVATVTVNPLPIVNAGNDTTLCDQPMPVTLVGTPAGGTWSGPNVTAAGMFTPNGVGTSVLTYTFTDGNGCVNSDQRTLNVIAPTQPNAGPDFAVCINSGNVNLAPTPVGGTWTGTNVTSAGVFSPVTVGTFTLVYSYGNGNCMLTDTLLATVNPLPIVDAGLDFARCVDAAAVPLTGSPLGGNWTGTGVTANTFSPATAGVGTHTLTYTYTDVNTCTASDVLSATVNPLPIVNAGNDTTLCDQPMPVTLVGTPAGGTWSGPNVTAAGIFTPNGVGTSVLTYTFTDGNGCVNSDQRTVNVIAPTQPNAGPDFAVCINSGNVNLAPTPVGGTWTGTNVTPAGVFSPVTVGTFTLVYSYGNGNCLLTDTLLATVNPLPIVDAGLDFARCVDAAAVPLTGSPLGGNWTGTGVTANTFSPATAGVGTHTLTYTYTDVNTCTASDVLSATVNPLPIVNAGNDTTLCDQPMPVTLVGTPAGGTWSGPNVTAAGIFTPNGVGTSVLTYTFTDGNGCVNSDQRNVNVIAPTQPNAGPDFAVCINSGNVNLAPTPVGGTWTGTNVTPAGVFSPVTVGTFTLVYSYGNGNCLLTDTLLATVNPLPIVDAGLDFARCVDAAAVPLTGSPLGGNWTGTGVTANTFSPATAGVGTHTLTYTYTDANVCTASDVLSATVNPLPIVNAGNDTTLCDQPMPVTIVGTPAGGTWSGPNVTATGIFTPNGVGTSVLTYTFTDGNGCVNSDQRNVNVVAPIQSNAGPDLEACIDAGSIQIAFTPLSGTWTGSGVNSSGLFTPTVSGTFELILSNGVGNCLTKDTMYFTVHPLPIVTVGPDASFCPNDAAVNFSGTPVNGIWSGTGITDINLGTFDPGVAGVGIHTIVYEYTNPITTCVNRDTLIAEVHPFPTAQFTYNPVACLGVQETFTNTSVLGNTYLWDFGDGSTSTQTSPTHTYAAAGFFNIKLIVTSAFGCLDSITQQVEVRVPPVADFTLAPDSACGPVLVNFTDLSTGPALSYNWNYGNGQTSTAAIPIAQTYLPSVNSDTTYTITLTLTNYCGTDIHTETVQVMPSPTAIFGTNTNIGCSPLTLNFVNNSIGLPDTYQWDLGDGTTSTSGASTFSHIYYAGQNDTTYNIQLIVTNECGADTVTHFITVQPNQVNAFFNVDAPSGCVPHTVNLTQFSQGSTFSSWDFGDGNVSTSYNATHTYTAPGTYTVSLFANDGCGFDTATFVITVFPSPVVDFSSMPDSVCINEVFTFTNLSSNISSVSWDFGDGGTSILTNPQHAYSASGTYQVTLSGVSQTNGCVGSITKPVVVSTNPIAAFTPSPNAGCEDLAVQFTNQSTNYNFQAWNFGDGNISTIQSPSHTYTSAGTFTISLYVENANGCADSIQQVVTVYPLPVADFNFTINNPCLSPATATFTNSSSGAANYEWDFGNSQTSTLTNPSTSYSFAGDYQVQLIATTIHGCKDTVVKPLSVFNQAVASFTLPNDSLCAGQEATFSSTAQFADSILWNFGNGVTVTGNPVNYAFQTNGVYPITLIAYGDGGCNDTITINTPITIVPSPTASFSYENVQVPDPASGTVEFTNESSGQVWNHWNFGNGNQSNELNPIERYEEYGEFNVMLVVGNEYGCTDTAISVVNVDFFYGLYIPNAMNPVHSEFEVANFIPKGVGLKTFELLIYDDWGNLIWSTTALDSNGRPTEYWDGTYMGVPVQQDAYVWKCTASFMNNEVWEGKEYPKGKIKRSGTVTVIR